MIFSVHIANVGLRSTPGILRRGLRSSEVSGLRYAETTIVSQLSKSPLPLPRLGSVGLIAAWEDDDALDEFSASHPLAARLAGGWHVRLEPLRVSGEWSAMPDLPMRERPVDDEEAVAVLTLGRLRYRRTVPFLRTSARAEGEALSDPALLASSGLARPPLVATFSLWRTAAAMRDYAHRRGDGTHPAAKRADSAKPFHRESAFVRFRPYAAQGSWDGHDPLATVTLAPA
jgi:hypothetical protein